MSARRLTDDEVTAALASLPGWAVVDGALHRELVFADFVAAFGFMTRVALVAERMDHHPAWSNVWNRVTIDLSTHDVGGLSTLDVTMAAAIDRLAVG